jgi:glycyl-tRNA synthetase
MTQLLPRISPRSFLPPPSILARTFTCSPALQKQNRNPKMATVKTKTGQEVDRLVLDSMLRRRMFYTPSFEIYGGVSGLYDYGPPGTALLANLTDTWRKHFVLEEDMLEVDCSMLTPHDILKTSGHVDKFADWMCKDPKTGEIFRADHLVEEVLESRLKGDKEARGQKVEVDAEKEAKKKKKSKGEIKAVKLDDALVKEYEECLAQIDNFDGPDLEKIIAKYDIRNPATGGAVEPPVAFNLMFQTSIGPSSNMPGYLRPETAQGQFLNFQKLLEFNQQSMPFASASIGKSFRNEISPRAGLLRVREFLMAEIEHYVDPEGGKKHPRFVEVKDIEMSLLDRNVQLSGSTKTTTMTIGKAVETGLVDNETLGYFLARIQLFLTKIGVDFTKLRFRQHMANEMAHYAQDCWDAELQTSYGWIECVGCADRSAYDLTVHKNKTGAPLVVRETRAEPLRVEEWQVDVEKKKFGPRFKKDAKAVENAIDALSQELREKLSLDLNNNGKVEIDVEGVGSGKVELDKELINIEKRTRVENVREYTPNVIEPSFGIGRILYSMIEHVYWSRDGDEARGVSFCELALLAIANLILYRFFPSPQPSLPPRFSWFLSPPTLPSSPWFRHCLPSCASLVSPAVWMTPPPVSVSVTPVTTSSVLPSVSPSTSSPSRTTPSPCVTATRPSRSVPVKTTSWLLSSLSPMATRPGRISSSACRSSLARRLSRSIRRSLISKKIYTISFFVNIYLYFVLCLSIIYSQIRSK